ncbi:hypothetical protein [Cupriavidus pauculus]|uniref:hypothetical protein n=1 Tax=Cupriavidus pauculus TaxID=82633 RepID=UPI001EE183E4|nr:hypothetical protein [Cupriavidus pauculus]GJG98547.1 hypothetical protein CBA19C6_28680 [Cupriavidus pauculus]
MTHPATLDKLRGMLLAQNVLTYALLRTLSAPEREALKTAYAAESERITEEMLAFPSSRDVRNGFEEQVNMHLQRLYALRSASHP